MAVSNDTVEVKEVAEGADTLARRSFPSELPLLTTPQVVIYPGMASPLVIDDRESVSMVRAALKTGNNVVALFGRVSGEHDEGEGDEVFAGSNEDDLYPVGAAVQLVRSQKAPDGRLQLLVQGLARIKIQRKLTETSYPMASVQELEDLEETSTRSEAMVRNVTSQFRKAVSLAPNVPKEVAETVGALPETGQKADFIATQLNLDFAERQEILGELNVHRRFETLNTYLNREVEILELREKINSEAAGTMEKAQREFFLRQQLHAIQEELGEEGSTKEIDELRDSIEAAGLPPEAKQEADRELSRMASTPQTSPEYSVSRTYLDWLANLPWDNSSDGDLDLVAAERVLNQDHYGLDKPKDRILEYLSVKRMKDDMRGPILCLVGPRGSARPRWANPSPVPWDGSSCACPWVGSGMSRRSAAIAAPTSEPCPDASCRACDGPAPTTPSSCSTRSTSWARTFAVIPHRRCWKCWIRSRTTPSSITISTWLLI